MTLTATRLLAATTLLLPLALPSFAMAQDGGPDIPGAVSAGLGSGQSHAARLLSVNENPPVLSPGVGRFKANIRDDEIRFDLRYDGLETDVLQAHIHFQSPWENGPITVWLCTNIGNTPPGATDRFCPEVQPARVTGVIVAADVQAALTLPAGDLEALKQAIRDGVAYVNVHTAANPPGEIRGQINARRR